MVNILSSDLKDPRTALNRTRESEMAARSLSLSVRERKQVPDSCLGDRSGLKSDRPIAPSEFLDRGLDGVGVPFSKLGTSEHSSEGSPDRGKSPISVPECILGEIQFAGKFPVSVRSPRSDVEIAKLASDFTSQSD
jgi:hypothetical protein